MRLHAIQACYIYFICLHIHLHLYIIKICTEKTKTKTKRQKYAQNLFCLCIANIFTPKILCNRNLFAFHFVKYTKQHVKRIFVFALLKLANNIFAGRKHRIYWSHHTTKLWEHLKIIQEILSAFCGFFIKHSSILVFSPCAITRVEIFWFSTAHFCFAKKGIPKMRSQDWINYMEHNIYMYTRHVAVEFKQDFI